MKDSFPTKILLPSVIVLFWLVMVFSLVKDRILPERHRARTALIDAEVLALQWSDIEEWNWIRRDGENRGGMGLVIMRNDEKKDRDLPLGEIHYTLRQNIEINIPVMGFTQKIQAIATLDLSPDFRIQKFIARAKAGSILSVEGEGFVRGKRFFYRMKSRQGGPYVYGYRDLGDVPLSLTEAVKPMMSRFSQLRVGESYSFDAFDAFGGQSAKRIKVLVAAKETLMNHDAEVPVFRLDTTFNGMTKSAWVNQAGVTLKSELLMGYVAEKDGRSFIAKEYPWMDEEIDLPEFDEEAFIQNALAAPAANEQPLGDGGLLSGLLGGG